MTAQNQRDPDGTDILGQVRDGLADLKANVISRWGRVPHVATDPTSLADGMAWIRSDTGQLRFRANGVTSHGDWTAVTFTNGWVNFNAGYQTCQYRKVADVVEIRGVMSTGTVASTAFTLPAGFRPASNHLIATVSNGAFGYITILSTGTFTPTAGSNVWFSIDCSFSTAA